MNNLNEIEDFIIEEARDRVTRRISYDCDKQHVDENFYSYVTSDPLFKLISENVIPDGTYRNNILFPNIAIALVKAGYTNEEIESMMKPIISKNFPNKSYPEFSGWLMKARKGEIKDYNQVQLNKWWRQYGDKIKGLV